MRRRRFLGLALCVAPLACSLTHDLSELDRETVADSSVDTTPGSCGLGGAPCCTSGSRCDVGLLCDETAGICVKCGAVDQLCCLGTKPCGDWMQCISGTCKGCGANPQPCCPGPGSVCQGTLSCIDKTCVRARKAGDSCCESMTCTSRDVCTEGHCCCGGAGACDACTAGGSCRVCCITCEGSTTVLTRKSCSDAAAACGSTAKVKKSDWAASCP